MGAFDNEVRRQLDRVYPLFRQLDRTYPLFRRRFEEAARNLVLWGELADLGSDPVVDDPVELLLSTAFDCAVKHNLPSCTVSWKCQPGEMRCAREACPCPVCGGVLVHYRDDHEGVTEGA